MMTRIGKSQKRDALVCDERGFKRVYVVMRTFGFFNEELIPILNHRH